MPASEERTEIVIIGGGQAGLALGYWLRRHKRDFVILDREPEAGGAWRHTWDSLTLFSPGPWSSLPGWLYPGGEAEYPTKDTLLDYIKRYEERYQFRIERPVNVRAVHAEGEAFRVETDSGDWRAPVVVSATGTWSKPRLPDYPGRELYAGMQLHSAHYRRPEAFQGQRVVVVGGGNSGAQILAEVSKVAQTRWSTLEPPQFLPDDVDGRVLFQRATERWKAKQGGRPVADVPGGFGDIVMVPPVREARDRGVLHSVGPLQAMTPHGVVWADGREEAVDAVIWCTGFEPALDHLSSLNLAQDGDKVVTNPTHSRDYPGLWLLGYGDWTGAASATLIGVGRSARRTAIQIDEHLTSTASAGPSRPQNARQGDAP